MAQLRTLLVTLVRHGESQDNQKAIWAGFKDSALTLTGVSQARALGYAFAHVPLAAIYSSDLKRAAATANEILNANVSVPVPLLVQSQSLREQNFGQAEGKAWKEGETVMNSLSSSGSSGVESRAIRFPEGESLEEVNARVATAVRRFVLPRLEALRNVPATSSEGIDPSSRPHICIVAHGIAIAELLRVFMTLHEGQYMTRTMPAIAWPWPHPRSTYKRVRLENTGWTRLELAVPAATIDPTVVELVREPSTPAPSADRTAVSGKATVEEGRSEEGDITAPDGNTVDGGAPRASVADTKQSPLPTSQSKIIFVRIANQNNTEHLRNIGAFAASTAASHMMGGGAMPQTNSPSVGASSGPMTPGKGSINLSSSGNAVSPSKSAALARSLGTYDMKVMAREMDRAGNTSVLSGDGQHSSSSGSGLGLGIGLGLSPSGGVGGQQSSTSGGSLGSGFGPTASLSGASLATNGTSISDVWHSVCVRVLPLFNGEGLRCPIEDINEAVSVHVKQTLDRGPARALDALSSDLTQLVTTGMYTLTSKLASIDGPTATSSGHAGHSSAQLSKYADERLLQRLVELWTMFWESVLPYIEGGFLPMQTDPVLVSLTSNTNKPISSSGGPNSALATGTSSISAPMMSGSLGPTSSASDFRMPGLGFRTERIDTRKVSLAAFRDCMVLPQLQRLSYLFSNVSLSDGGNGLGLQEDAIGRGGVAGAADESLLLYPRLLQMTSVLASVLSGDAAQSGMNQLLRALRIGRAAAVGHDGGAGWSASGLASTIRGGANRSRPSHGGNPLRKTRNQRPSWLPREAATYGQTAQEGTNGTLGARNDRGGADLFLSMSPRATFSPIGTFNKEEPPNKHFPSHHGHSHSRSRSASGPEGEIGLLAGSGTEDVFSSRPRRMSSSGGITRPPGSSRGSFSTVGRSGGGRVGSAGTIDTVAAPTTASLPGGGGIEEDDFVTQLSALRARQVLADPQMRPVTDGNSGMRFSQLPTHPQTQHRSGSPFGNLGDMTPDSKLSARASPEGNFRPLRQLSSADNSGRASATGEAAWSPPLSRAELPVRRETYQHASPDQAARQGQGTFQFPMPPPTWTRRPSQVTSASHTESAEK